MLLFLLPLKKKSMAKSEVRERIGGAPEWVQEFLQRIEDRDEIRDEKERLVHERMLKGLQDLSGDIGSLSGALGRLDQKVEVLRREIMSTKRAVSEHNTRLEALEAEVHEVHTQLSSLHKRLDSAESEIRVLRNGETPA